jgi:carbamoyl-phosphate synthase large subunit
MNNKTEEVKVLIWGVAGASLGMELAKSLSVYGNCAIHGADISPYAFGNFSGLFVANHLVRLQHCKSDICDILRTEGINFLVAGGDLVARLCAEMETDIRNCGTTYVGNNAATVAVCSDKYKCFRILLERTKDCPKTELLGRIIEKDWEENFPLILKPRWESGGSRGVRVLDNYRQLKQYKDELSGDEWICQEYLPDLNNELTIGVLSNINGRGAGAIILRRMFHNMLSVHDRTDSVMISSGSSQGTFIRDRLLERAAMEIAESLGSTGPLNIQCRLKEGRIWPFEINPRFSASTYLRSLAGVNEIALYLNHLITGESISYPQANEGLVLRSFAEVFIPDFR